MIAIGCDHGGFKLKEEIKKYLEEIGLEYKDFGTYNEERTDYPIYAKEVAKSVSDGECEKGILICRSGHGMSVVANKFKGVRAASITNEDDAINVITLPGDYISLNEAIVIVRTWIAAEFKGGRYQDRLDMIDEIEKKVIL